MNYSWDAGGSSASATLSSAQEKALNEAKPFNGIPAKENFVDDVVFLKDVSIPDGETYFLKGDEVKALGQGGNVTGIIIGSGGTLPTAVGNKDNYFLLESDDGTNKAGIYKSDDTNWTVSALFGSNDTDAGEPWKENTNYKAGEAFTFSTTNTTAKDINDKEIKPNTTLIGAYKVDTTSSATLTNAEMAKFELVSGGADEATFLTLPDTFNDFTDKANFIVRVNLAKDAIEAVELLASMSKYDDTVTQFGLSGVDLNTQKAIEKLKALIDTPLFVADNFKDAGDENTLGINKNDDTIQKVFDKLEDFILTIPKAFDSVVLVTDDNLAEKQLLEPTVTVDDLLFEFKAQDGTSSYIVTPLDKFIDLSAIKNIGYKTPDADETILELTKIDDTVIELDLSRFFTKDLNDTWKDVNNPDYETKGSTSFKQLDDTFTRKEAFKLHTYRASMFNSMHTTGNISYSNNKLSVDDIIIMKLPNGAVWNIDVITDLTVGEDKLVYFDTTKELVLQGLAKSIPQSDLKLADVSTYIPNDSNFQVGYVSNGKFIFTAGQTSETETTDVTSTIWKPNDTTLVKGDRFTQVRLSDDKRFIYEVPQSWADGTSTGDVWDVTEEERYTALSEDTRGLINHIVVVATTNDATLPEDIPKDEKVFATNTNDIYNSNGDDSFTILDKSTFDEYMLLEVKDTKSTFHFNKADGTFVKYISNDRLITQSFTFPANKDLEAFMADDTYFPTGHNGVFKTTEDITVTADSMNVFDNLKTLQIDVDTYDIPKNSMGTIKKESNGVITVMFTTAGILDPLDTGVYIRTKQDDGSTSWASVEMVGESSEPVIEEYSLQPADGTNDDIWHEVSSSSFTMNVGMRYIAEVKAKMRTMNVIRELKLEIVNNNTGVRHLVGFNVIQDASDSSDGNYDKGIENTHIIGRFSPQENGEYTLVFSRRNTSARTRPWFFTGQESANYTDLDSNVELRVVRTRGITENINTNNKYNTITACGNEIDLALGVHYTVTATATEMTAINPIVGQGGTIKIIDCENITGWSADFILAGELATATLSGVNRFGYIVESDSRIVVGWVQ